MPLDLRVWPVRTAPISDDGPRLAFQIRNPLVTAHRGEWDLAADWTPVWIGFGITWHNGDEPLPWQAHKELWRALDSFADHVRFHRRLGGVRRLPVARGRVPVAGQTRLTSLPKSDTIRSGPGTLGRAFNLGGRSTMSSAIKKIASATAVTLVAGLGLTGSPGSATAATGGFCEGQSAPANTDPSNQAPVPTNDTVNALAGTLTTIKVLANDTDPDGDRLYLENASSPRRGEICVQRNGTIEFLADGSRSNYVSTFTYGVTDGDRYRTGDGHRERPGPPADAARRSRSG